MLQNAVDLQFLTNIRDIINLRLGVERGHSPHFVCRILVIRAKHSLELKGQVIWDLSLSGRYLTQSATQPQNYDQ
jgi:hypothetical protein